MKNSQFGFLFAILFLISAFLFPLPHPAGAQIAGSECFESYKEGKVCVQIERYGICQIPSKSIARPPKGCVIGTPCQDGSVCAEASDSSKRGLCGTNRNVDPWEECDDNNQIGGDGCNTSCQIERGWKCALDDVSDLSVCAPIVGWGNVTGKSCTLFNNSSKSNEQCLFDNPLFTCLPGEDRETAASICRAGKVEKCLSGNICVSGKCQPEKIMGLNFINGFNPNLETIFFVPGAGSSTFEPNLIRGISDKYENKFNIVYFPYDVSDWTADIAKSLNVAVEQLLNLNGGYDKKIRIVAHSNGHLVTRTAILQANGYTQSSPTVSDNKIKNDKVAAAYRNSEFYSVSGVIGGSSYASSIPLWPAWFKYQELSPFGPFQNWLFSEAMVAKFNSAIGNYRSFDSVGDPHLKDLEDCGIQGLSKRCANYKRGISADHIKFNSVDENLMTDNHPGFSDIEAQAMLEGLNTAWGTPDREYCKNGLVTYTFSSLFSMGRNVGHSALLFHPTVIAAIGADTPTKGPTVSITNPPHGFNIADDYGNYPVRVAFSASTGRYVKEAKLYVDNVDKKINWPNSRPYSPATYSLVTRYLTSGPHTLKYVVTDDLGRTASAERRFNIVVNTPPDTTGPVIELTNPAFLGIITPWPPVGDYFYITVRAKDPSGVSSFNICIDNRCSEYTNITGATSCPTTFGSNFVTCYARIPIGQVLNNDKNKTPTTIVILASDRASPAPNFSLRGWQITQAGIQ